MKVVQTCLYYFCQDAALYTKLYSYVVFQDENVTLLHYRKYTQNNLIYFVFTHNI